jgi:hypothetical protein
MIRSLLLVLAAGLVPVVTLNACGGAVAPPKDTDAGPVEVVTPWVEAGIALDSSTIVSYDAEAPFDASFPPPDAFQDEPTTPTACVLPVGTPTDAGFVPNGSAEMCLVANCSAQSCPCASDPNVVNAGTPACVQYFDCVSSALVSFVANTPDAGAYQLQAVLEMAQQVCGAGLPASSRQMGDATIGCLAANCASSWPQ